IGTEAIAQAEAALAASTAEVEKARAAAAGCGEALRAGQDREAQATDLARETERVLARLKAEAEALEKIVAPGESEADHGRSMLSLLQVTEGFEAATAALFDGELAAPELSSDANAG